LEPAGGAAYAGWCLAFIEDALEKSNGIEIFGGDSAKESAVLYSDAMRQGTPERDAFVFYDCICRSPDGPVNWGHCGIGLGDGSVIHAWDTVRIDDYRQIEAMTALSGDHPRYIGWVPVERVLKQKAADRHEKFEQPEETMVELRAITEDNFLDAFHLELAPGQERFVSHPIRSLAQAYVYREQCQPFGIYEDGKMVGYVMVIYDYDVPEYDIWHMMIDKSMQGRGLGSAALGRVLDYIRTKPFGDSSRVALTCNKDNTAARKLYERRGFRSTGTEDEDEIELAMTVD